MRGVAVGADGGVLVDAVLVFEQRRRRDADGAALQGRLRKRSATSSTSRAMSCTPSPCWTSRWLSGCSGPSGETSTKRDVALAQDVARLVLQPGFQPGIGDDVEAEGVAIEIRRLPGVADEEADVVDAAQGEGVGSHGDFPRSGWRVGLMFGWHVRVLRKPSNFGRVHIMPGWESWRSA